jgi:ribosomal protein L16 Arg81 hydroxylase
MYNGSRVPASNAQSFGPPWLFAAVLDPLSAAQFGSEYWARRPLRILRSAPTFYEDLFSLAHLERYLSQDELFTRHAVATPSNEPGLPDPPPGSVSEVYERLLQGNSLRMRRMECFLDPSSPLRSLLRDMELSLQHPLDSLSCYVSPPDGKGLGPHHDESEIFTLQISGTKRWRIFHRVASDQPGIYNAKELADPVQDFVLNPGDLLYLPSGYVHDVIPTGTPSFSLTIVFSPFRWRAVLDLLLTKLVSSSAFVEPIPAGVLFARTRADSLEEELRVRLDLIRNAISDLSVDSLIEELASKQVQHMTMPPDQQIGNLFCLETIALETWLEKRPGIAVHLSRSEGKVRLILPGGYTVEANERAEPAFRDILASDHPFQVSAMHNSLSDAAKLVLARKLVGCGLLRLPT